MSKSRRNRKSRNRKSRQSRKGGSRRFFPSQADEVRSIQSIQQRFQNATMDEKVRLIPELCDTFLMSRYIFKNERFYNTSLAKMQEFRGEPALRQFIPLIDETLDHMERAHRGEFNSMPASRY